MIVFYTCFKFFYVFCNCIFIITIMICCCILCITFRIFTCFYSSIIILSKFISSKSYIYCFFIRFFYSIFFSSSYWYPYKLASYCICICCIFYYYSSCYFCCRITCYFKSFWYFYLVSICVF